MSNNVEFFCKRFGVSRKEIAEAIGKSIRTVGEKINSNIPWTQKEIMLVTQLLKTKDEKINVETIFFKDLYSNME